MSRALRSMDTIYVWRAERRTRKVLNDFRPYCKMEIEGSPVPVGTTKARSRRVETLEGLSGPK